jgi:membrane protein YqaA with SNARE-associated domain
LWGLAVAVAMVMALEASLLTGVVVPGDLVVLFAAATATTPTKFVVLWAAVAAGSVVGETVGYGIGHRFGVRVQAGRAGRWLGPQRWARAAAFLQRRGARAVFAASLALLGVRPLLGALSSIGVAAYGWLATGFGFGAVVVWLALVERWSRRRGWGGLQVLAAAAAGLLGVAGEAFFVEPLGDVPATAKYATNVVLLAIVVLLLVLAARAQRHQAEDHSLQSTFG